MTDPTQPREVIVISHAPSADVLGDIPGLVGYTNHIGSCEDAAGNIFWAVTVDGPGANDTDVAIMRRDVHTAAWEEVYRFTQAAFGKHGYGTLEVLPGGALSCGLSERNAQNQTVAVERFVPAEKARAVWYAGGASGAGEGGGGFTPAPNGQIRIVATPVEGAKEIPLTPLGIPAGVSAFSVRICIAAAAVGRRGRVGPNTNSSGAAMITVATQAIAVRNYASGVVGPGPNNTLTVWVDNGPLSEFYVDVLGWWY